MRSSRINLEKLPGPADTFPASAKNADLPFIRFFVKLMFDIYPKRIGQVLLVGAPLIFQPLWQVIKPLLGKYAGIVQFCSVKEAAAYFASGADSHLE